jgi:hypothetical protein
MTHNLLSAVVFLVPRGVKAIGTIRLRGTGGDMLVVNKQMMAAAALLFNARKACGPLALWETGLRVLRVPLEMVQLILKLMMVVLTLRAGRKIQFARRCPPLLLQHQAIAFMLALLMMSVKVLSTLVRVTGEAIRVNAAILALLMMEQPPALVEAKVVVVAAPLGLSVTLPRV